MTLTLQRYRAMVTRFAERKDKRERVYRYAKQIPFTLDQFREWVVKQLGGSEEGSGRCAYCGIPFDIGTMVIDHRMPPNRGGSLNFDNLCACCDPCNSAKGGMSDQWYLHLVKFLDGIPESEKRDVISRLRSAVKLASGQRWANRPKTEKKQQEEEAATV